MTLSPESADRILSIYETAKVNGALISVDEVLLLLPEKASRGELLEMISTTPALSSRLEHQEGYLTPRESASSDSDHLSREVISRGRAAQNIVHAGRFLPLMRRVDPPLVAISGSTSYYSASRSTDLDFFCVIRRGSFWLSLTKLLLVARAYRLTNRNSPEICLSCMMDESYASLTFASNRGPVFARDALQTIVMHGEATYLGLLGRARWISNLYPMLYEKRLRPWVKQSGFPQLPKTRDIVLNKLLYALVGSYIRLKGLIRNRSLMHAGRRSETFHTLMGEDHLIYESDRYRQMHDLFTNANGGSEGVQNS